METTQKNLSQMGKNLQKVVKYLMGNQTLVRYLHYTDKDPLAVTKEDVDPQELLHKELLIVPQILDSDDSISRVSVKIISGEIHNKNNDFTSVTMTVDVFVPMTQWILKSDNLRPFLIMGEIQKTLNGKEIAGIGVLECLSFDLSFITEEMGCYQMVFAFNQFT